MVEQSSISVRDGKITGYYGSDATKLYRAKVTAAALGLYAKTGRSISRGITLTLLLSNAKDFTGKTFPKSRAGAEKAREAVLVWAREMEAALPREPGT